MAQTGPWRSWRRWQKVVAIAAACFFALSVIGIISTAVGGGGKKKTEAGAAALASPTLTNGERAYVAAVATAQAAATLEDTAHSLETIASQPTSTPRPTATPIPPPYQLALISASCTQQSDIGFNECQGFVKNISGSSLQNVEVVISWVDDNGVPQASDDALIDYNPILAGQESPWSSVGTYNPALRRFRVGFKDLLGGTILTRDDR